MTGKCVLDKNPKKIDLDIFDNFSERGPNIILASHPFHKVKLAISLLNHQRCPVIFLDFDLLYSGYITSGMIQKTDDVCLIRPRKQEWRKIFHDILLKISAGKYMVIIDSLNGFHNMYDKRESARFVNASLMLLAYVGRFHMSPVVALGLGRKNVNNQWVLSPRGIHIPRAKILHLYGISETDSTLSILPLDYDMSN